MSKSSTCALLFIMKHCMHFLAFMDGMKVYIFTNQYYLCLYDIPYVILSLFMHHLESTPLIA